MARSLARRWAPIALPVVLLAALTVGAALAVGPPTQPNAHAHKVVYPTVAAAAAHRASQSPAAAAANLVYGGGVDGIGVTTGAPKVYVVFWGTQWGTATT